jgi:hypothetical protein
MRRWGISLPLLLGCVSRQATGGARVSLGALRGMPDNRYQRLWPFIPTRGFLGTAQWLSSRGHLTVCLDPPCKVINQSIVGLSPLSKTTYSTGHEIPKYGSWWISCLINCIAQLMLAIDGYIEKNKSTRTCAKILKVRTHSLLLFSKRNPSGQKAYHV